MDNSYCVYVHTNKTNGKRYVGITSRAPEVRWKNGFAYKNNQHLSSAIKKYGWDGFEHIVLHSHISHDEACRLERQYIADWNLRDDRFGYNLTGGGEGSVGLRPSAITRKKMSLARLGKNISEEQRLKIQNSAHKKSVAMLSIDGVLLNTYPSLREAGRQNNISNSHISACCRGERKHAGGYVWKYIENNCGGVNYGKND